MADRCRSCGALITFAITDKRKRIPLDPPAEGGNLFVWTDDKGIRRASTTNPGVPSVECVSHFVTCPQAGKHRRR